MIKISPQTNFVLDEGTTEAIFQLKKPLKAKSFIGVIRKSIALARIAGRNLDEEGNLTLIDAKGRKMKVIVRG